MINNETDGIRCVAYCNREGFPLYYLTNRAILHAPELRPTEARYTTRFHDWIPTPENFVLVPNDQAVDIFYTSWEDFENQYLEPMITGFSNWEFLGLVVTYRFEDRRWLVDTAVLSDGKAVTVGEPWILYTNENPLWVTN